VTDLLGRRARRLRRLPGRRLCAKPHRPGGARGAAAAGDRL